MPRHETSGSARAVDDAVRRHYAAQRLADEAVDRILREARAEPTVDRGASASPVDPEPTSGRGRAGARVLFAVAAALALVVAGLLWHRLAPSPAGDRTDELTRQVVAEVAKNHRKGSPIEIESSRWEEVQASLDRLDFAILPTRPSLLRDYELVGGRYCSIQSRLAAQLSLRERDTGRTQTLYVAPLAAPLDRLEPHVGRDGAVEVTLWRDDGRLFALAADETAH